MDNKRCHNIFEDVRKALNLLVRIDPQYRLLLPMELTEKVVHSSAPYTKVVSLASNYGFYTPYTPTEDNKDELLFYYGGDYGDDKLRLNFGKFSDIIKRCGWTVKQSGNHYDGLRDYYKRYQSEHPEFGVGTFFVNVESEYGTEMDDHFGEDGSGLSNNVSGGDGGYWSVGFSSSDREHLGVRYRRGVFYHITERGNLKSIMSHGLRPRNGGGITGWRDTSDRLYLSLLPQFNEVDYGYAEDEQTDEDVVILRIDLRSKMDNFKFYVDNNYNDAVYTYSEIPPQFIEVIGDNEIMERKSMYYLRYATREALMAIVERNFSSCDERTRRERVRKYRYDIEKTLMPNIVLNRFRVYHIQDRFKTYVGSVIKDEIDNYLSG